MKRKAPTPNLDQITFNHLKSAFESSGFRVVLRRPTTLEKLAQREDNLARLRQISAQTLGLIMPEAGEIAINAALPLQERVITLLHELVHLYDDSLTEKQTERQAQRVFKQLTPEQHGWLEFVVGR